MAAVVASVFCSALGAQTMSIEEYEPKSTLVVPEHIVKRAKYPFIDVHNHQYDLTPAKVDKLVADMDGINLRIMVNLSGGYGEKLKQNVHILKDRYKDRFVVFANLDFSNIDAPDYPERPRRQLEQDVHNGAQGLKFFKNFGMDLKDSKGQRIHVDDPRFNQAFELCAKLKIPVLIHTAEPRSFFRAAGSLQRALAGVEAISTTSAATGPLSELGNTDRGTASPFRHASEHDVHQRASGLAGRKPGGAGPAYGSDCPTCTRRSARCLRSWAGSRVLRASG